MNDAETRHAYQLSRRNLLAMTAGAAGALAIGLGGQPALAQEGTPRRGGTVRGAVALPITSLDPYTAKAASGDFIAFRAIYNNLIEVSGESEFVPELASEWTISEDGLTYTFTIVEGVTFHDGTALDAAAIKFNIDRYIAENSTFNGAGKLRVIETVDAPDATTVVLNLSRPSAPLMDTLTTCHIVSPTAVEEMGDDLSLHGVGSGPFKVESWEPGSLAVFVRNENYWEIASDGEPFPYLDQYEIEGVPDDSVRLLNLRSGQFQILERVNPRDIASVQADPNIELVETPHAVPNLVAMNPNIAPFDNKALRQAVSYALDRQAIVDNISFGTGYTVPLPFPKGSWFYIEEPAPVFDPEKAKALLAEAGYPDGIEVTMTHINRTIDTQIAQIMKAQLEAVGITMTIESLERTTWVDMWAAGEGQLGLLQGAMTPTDPDRESGIFQKDSLNNWTDYNNEDIQRLIDEANSVTDREQRLATWQEIAALVVDDAVYVYIGAIPTIAGVSASVKNLEFVSGMYWENTRTWIDE
jgi:peptide/nickel transport system substrate-binding protein